MSPLLRALHVRPVVAAEPAAARRSDWARWACTGAFVAFLIVLLQPVILDPLQLGPAAAWMVVCYAFAVPVLLLRCSDRSAWAPTRFDYVLAAYCGAVLITWPTSLNARNTASAIVALAGYIAVFYAVRRLVRESPILARLLVAALIVGIAALVGMATVYHVRYGLAERLTFFPALDWNGRQGLGFLGAIQFALLVGVWQRSRSHPITVASVILLIVSVVELMFLYARDPWVAAIAVMGVALVTTIRIGGFRRFIVPLGAIALVVVAARTPFIVHLARMAVGLEGGIEGGLDVRLASWRYAATIIAQRPLAGLGLGNFATAHASVYPGAAPFLYVGYSGAAPQHPHNLFLQQIAETGVIGGAAYLGVWVVGMWAGWTIATRPGANAASNALFYALLAVVVMNLGENMFLEAVAAERARLHTLGWMLLACVLAESERSVA